MLLKPVFDSLRRMPWPGVPQFNLLLLLALAALLAHWTWRFAAPVPPVQASGPRADIKLDTVLASLRAAPLFGAAGGQANASAEQVTSLNLKLHGVFAAPDGLSAMAILAVDGKDQAIATGYEVVPGVVLDAVAPDHVVLLNRGVRERLELEALGRPLTLDDGDVPVSRQDINQVLASPQSLGVQAKASTDGNPGLLLVSVDADGLAARLGLQSGDLLRMVNGTPVKDMQDFAEMLPSTTNLQRVTLMAERQGKPLTLTFKLQ